MVFCPWDIDNLLPHGGFSIPFGAERGLLCILAGFRGFLGGSGGLDAFFETPEACSSDPLGSASLVDPARLVVPASLLVVAISCVQLAWVSQSLFTSLSFWDTQSLLLSLPFWESTTYIVLHQFWCRDL